MARGGRHLCMGAIVQWRMVGSGGKMARSEVVGQEVPPSSQGQLQYSTHISRILETYQECIFLDILRHIYILGHVSKMCLQTSFAQLILNNRKRKCFIHTLTSF